MSELVNGSSGISPKAMRGCWLPGGIGLLVGTALELNRLAEQPEALKSPGIWGLVLGAAVVTAVVFIGLYLGTACIVHLSSLPARVKERFILADRWTYLAFLGHLSGAFGLRFGNFGWLTMAALFLAGKVWILARNARSIERDAASSETRLLSGLFFLSGFAALVYQVAWQRCLLGILGVEMEAVALIVAAFMLGLGVGSIAGGAGARFLPVAALPLVFCGLEVLIGLFGLISLRLFEWVGATTLVTHTSIQWVSLLGVLILPTLPMGASLPVLVTFLRRRQKTLGGAVGLLYFVSTLGSAVACFVAADMLFVLWGLRTSVGAAAAVNLAVGVVGFLFLRRKNREARVHSPSAGLHQEGGG